MTAKGRADSELVPQHDDEMASTFATCAHGS